MGGCLPFIRWVANPLDNIIKLDNEPVGEDGVAKPFWQYQKNTSHVAFTVSNMPNSGCVFMQGVGYHCFGCITTYYAYAGDDYVNHYEFEEDKVFNLDALGVNL
jgi:hypothetical protein